MVEKIARVIDPAAWMDETDERYHVRRVTSLRKAREIVEIVAPLVGIEAAIRRSVEETAG